MPKVKAPKFEVRYADETEWVLVESPFPNYPLRLALEAAERFVDDDYGANSEYFHNPTVEEKIVVVREVLDGGYGAEVKYKVSIDYYPTFLAEEVID